MSPISRSPCWRVLLVEDEMLVAMMLQDMLTDLGHEIVGVAPRLAEALAMARDVTCDLAILDVHLDGKDVFPVADLLAERNIPFAFASGYSAESLPEAHRSRPTLLKPFHRNDVEKLIASLPA